MSGPPGVLVQSPAERAGRAVLVSVQLLPSPPSAQDPSVRTGHVTTQPSAPVSVPVRPLQRERDRVRKEQRNV